MWTRELWLKPVTGHAAGMPVMPDQGAGLEQGRRRHVRVIGGAGRLVGAKADIPVTARD